MKTTALLSILLATLAAASPAPIPNAVTSAPAGSVTAAPDPELVTSQLTKAACHPNKTCVADHNKIPKCASKCINSAASKAKCHGELDLNCRCSASSVIGSLAESCIVKACGEATALKAQSSVAEVCVCNAKNPYSHCATSTDKGTHHTKAPEHTHKHHDKGKEHKHHKHHDEDGHEHKHHKHHGGDDHEHKHHKHHKDDLPKREETEEEHRKHHKHHDEDEVEHKHHKHHGGDDLSKREESEDEHRKHHKHHDEDEEERKHHKHRVEDEEEARKHHKHHGGDDVDRKHHKHHEHKHEEAH